MAIQNPNQVQAQAQVVVVPDIDVLDTLTVGIGAVESAFRDLRRSKGDATAATVARTAAETRLTEAKVTATSAHAVVADQATVVGTAIDALIATLTEVKATL